MCATSEPSNGRLQVAAPSAYADIIVYDGAHRARWTAVGGLDEEVAVGLYKVEVRVLGATETKVVSVEEGGEPSRITRDEWALVLPSAAPLTGSDAPESQRSAAVERSKAPPSEISPGDDPRGQLFVFTRRVAGRDGDGFCRDLTLAAADGSLKRPLHEGGTPRDLSEGWAAESLALPAGAYLITEAHPDHPARTQALWVTPGCQTQVFIPGGSRPLLGELSISMRKILKPEYPPFGFDPDSPWSHEVEVALHALRSGVNTLTKAQLRVLLTDKFSDPWLGILAAYVLNLRAEPPAGLIDTVLGYLGGLLGEDHPDWRALELRAGRWDGRPFPTPPMVATGLRWVLEYTASDPDIVPEDSLTDRVSDRVDNNAALCAWIGEPEDPETLRFERMTALVSAAHDRGIWGGSPSPGELKQLLAPEEAPALAPMTGLAAGTASRLVGRLEEFDRPAGRERLARITRAAASARGRTPRRKDPPAGEGPPAGGDPLVRPDPLRWGVPPEGAPGPGGARPPTPAVEVVPEDLLAEARRALAELRGGRMLPRPQARLLASTLGEEEAVETYLRGAGPARLRRLTREVDTLGLYRHLSRYGSSGGPSWDARAEGVANRVLAELGRGAGWDPSGGDS